MIDEEESERAYARSKVLEELLSRTKESLVNEMYNDIIRESVCEDSIHYMGWFWRNCDFIAKDVTIGKDQDNLIGVMANNKWGYPERQMTEPEVDTFMELIDRVIAVNHGLGADVSFYRKKRSNELREWMQKLTV